MELSATRKIELDGSVSGQIVCDLMTDTPDGMVARQSFQLPESTTGLGGRTTLYPAFQFGHRHRIRLGGSGTLKLFSVTAYSQVAGAWRRSVILAEPQERWVVVQPEATIS